MPRRFRDGALLGLGALMLLAGCAITPPMETERRLNADGSVCPDPGRPLPFPVTRPTCWTDEEWELYLREEADRARRGLNERQNRM